VVAGGFGELSLCQGGGVFIARGDGFDRSGEPPTERRVVDSERDAQEEW
jgi:hypothetical protein